MALNEGQVLAGKYRIEKLLGEGGMGAVYVALNEVLQRRVALKVMNERFAAVPAAVERFHREAIAASRVSHPGIVQVFDAGSHEGKPWIAMELLEGESLGDRLERGAMSLDEVLKMATGALSALAEVHDEGIVHRDLKPDNIFLAKNRSGDWTPKVLDFGVAKDTSEGQLSKLTATGAVVGTAYYLSPEQAKGLPDIDPRTDVYAMGVVIYECLSDEMPFEAESITQLIAKMFTEEPRPLNQVAPHVPRPIADVVDTCLQQDRARRFQTARALLGALEAAAEATRSGAAGSTGGADTGFGTRPTEYGAQGGLAARSSADAFIKGRAAPLAHAGTMVAGGVSEPGHASASSYAPDSYPRRAAEVSATSAGQDRRVGNAPTALMQGSVAGFGPGATPAPHASAGPTPAETRRFKAGLVGLVGVLFLLGAGATAGVAYLVLGDEPTASAVAHADLPRATGGPAVATTPTPAEPRTAQDDLENEPEPAGEDGASPEPATPVLASAETVATADERGDEIPATPEDAEAEAGTDDPEPRTTAARRREARRTPARSRASEQETDDSADEDAPSRPTPAPRPRSGLTTQQVMTVVQSRLGFLQSRCYERRVRRVPNLQGVVTIAWTVRSDGRVEDARVVHNGSGDDWLGRCTMNVVRDLRFPAAANGQPTPARYPFRFGR